MKFLSSVRTSVLFLGGLTLAASIAMADDAAWQLFLGSRSRITTQEEPSHTIRSPRQLEASDNAAAATAWAYFQANTRPETGLVDSVAGFPSTTIWDQASYFLALSAASRLGLIDGSEFRARATKGLNTLKSLPLVVGQLPNKVYNTQTLEMVDYANQPVPGGIGWSALDISRMLLALRILENELPEVKPLVREAVSRWNLSALTRGGEIIGASRENGVLVRSQEGRIGYEQYAARALLLWGVDASVAVRADRIAAWETVQGIDIAIDQRSMDSFRAVDSVLSEPYALLGIEMGFDEESAVLGSRVYDAQEARYEATGVPTVVSEDHIDQAPYFLFSSVYSDKGAWSVVSDTGEEFPGLRSLSTKAVFAWDALYQTPYTKKMRGILQSQPLDTKQGWLAGIFESNKDLNDALSLNTNAVVLEAICFKAFGPMLHL